MLIRRGDLVEVISGDDRGSTGRVLQVLRDTNKVVVEGMNKVYKHVRPRNATHAAGGSPRRCRSTSRTYS